MLMLNVANFAATDEEDTDDYDRGHGHGQQ